MIKNTEQLEYLLRTESVGEPNILPLDIPRCVDIAFALEVKNDAQHMWETLRKLLPRTGRWPVLYTLWGHPQNTWEDYVRAADIFTRRPFEWENRDDNDTSPEAIVARSELTSFEDLLQTHAHLHSLNLWEDYGYLLEKTKQRFGFCPDAEEVESLIKTKKISNYVELEHWLLRWELQHIARNKSLPPADTGYLQWYVPQSEPQALILLPTANCWEALAYIHWYGAEAYGSETAIAMLRWWREKYGAELVAHYGTMLHIAITRRPSSIEEAFRLAWEQEAFAPCTTALPGESLRDHARALMQADKWFLHERP